VQTGYYSPEEVENLEEGRSIEELVTGWAPTDMVPQLRTLLGAFLFHGEDVYKPVSVLSGGEKSRLALLRLLLQPTNLLFLDEPTNHLDLQSKDILLDALKRYAGTVVFVSHDRNFIDALADRVAEVGGGGVRPYTGDYAYYLYRKSREQAGAGGVSPAAPSSAMPEIPQPAAVPQPAKPAEARREQDKAQRRELRRLEREEEQLLAKLEDLEQQKTRLEQLLGREDVYRDGPRVREIKEELEGISGRRERLMRRWETVDKQRREI
jgi:ATP-binding cassette subfamily F protein 3